MLSVSPLKVFLYVFGFFCRSSGLLYARRRSICSALYMNNKSGHEEDQSSMREDDAQNNSGRSQLPLKY